MQHLSNLWSSHLKDVIIRSWQRTWQYDLQNFLCNGIGFEQFFTIYRFKSKVHYVYKINRNIKRTESIYTMLKAMKYRTILHFNGQNNFELCYKMFVYYIYFLRGFMLNNTMYFVHTLKFWYTGSKFQWIN